MHMLKGDLRIPLHSQPKFKYDQNLNEQKIEKKKINKSTKKSKTYILAKSYQLIVKKNCPINNQVTYPFLI